MAIEQKLTEDNPANTDVRVLLANSHRFLGRLLSLAGKISEAEAECRSALAINQKLAGDDPANTYFRYYLADSHGSLGYVLLSAGELSEAEAQCRTALANRSKADRRGPRGRRVPRRRCQLPRQPRRRGPRGRPAGRGQK